MFTISYANNAEKRAAYKNLIVGRHTATQIIQSCETHEAAMSDTHLIVSVTDWDKAIDIVNDDMCNGYTVYRELITPIKLPN